MLKSIQSLFLLSLCIPVLANPAFAKEQNTSKVSTEYQTLKLYKGYFPYQVCLLVTINQVVKKPDGVLLLEVTIGDVYCGNYKKGSPLAISFNECRQAPESFVFLKALKNTKQIIAFNHWPKGAGNFDDLAKASKNPICSLWMPYANKEFRLEDIAQIKKLIDDAPTKPAQMRAAFQKFLETKWTTDRINDFCRLETQANWMGPSEHSANTAQDWHDGRLHAGKVTELSGKKVEWQASVNANIPTWYNIHVTSPNEKITCWELETAAPSLEVWTDENFLIHRVSHSIYQAAFAHWLLNRNSHPEATKYWNLFSARSKEVVVKGKDGQVTNYQCHLGNGKILTAMLTADKMQAINKLVIDGKPDFGWNDMYKNTLANLMRCKDLNHPK